ncbi:MAG: hypothetical protein IJH60_07500, partial [Eubacterium sp.]|nr:hypothetical protein [Eubacterium sp.]
MDKLPPLRKRFMAILISILMITNQLSIMSPVAAYASDVGQYAYSSSEGSNAKTEGLKAATQVGDDVTVLAFTSDVHNAANNTAANRQSGWIDTVIDKYGRIDAMGFCGDMGSDKANESEFWAFTRSAMDVVDQKNITDVYTTGNHEFKNGNYSGTSDDIVNDYIVDGEGLVGDNYRIYCLGTENWDNSTDNYTT